MASSFPLVLNSPKSYCSFPHWPWPVNSIQLGPSASMGNTGLAIINPGRSEGKNTPPKSRQASMRRLLSGNCVSMTGVCGNRGV